MARNVFGLPGEKAFSYSQGDFRIVVGFLNSLARYAAVVRDRGPNTKLTPAEIAGALALNAPPRLWNIETPDAPKKSSKPPRRKTATPPSPTTYFSYVEKSPKKTNLGTSEIHGWMPGTEPYAFFYLPHLDGQSPLLVSEWGVQQALG
jgi:hypothetical protein